MHPAFHLQPPRRPNPFSHRQGGTSTSPEDPPKDGDSLLIDNILLPTAKLSKDLLESNVLVDSETRTPEEAHSQEEAVLLSYVENRKKHHALSILDGIKIGILTGVGAGLASIPIALGLNKMGVLKDYPHRLEKGNFLKFVMYHLLFQGFEEVAKTDKGLKNKLVAILPNVLKTTAFGVISGAFLSMYLTKHQVKSAKHIANEWHENSEKAQVFQDEEKKTNAKTQDPYKESPNHSLEKTLSYPEWKHFAENWKHHVVEALKFNFIISTAVLGVQIAGLVSGLWLAKHEGVQVKKYFDAIAQPFEDPKSPLHFANTMKGGLVGWIKAKSQMKDSATIHKSFQAEWPTLALGWLTGRFSLLSVARLSMLSVLTAKFWADKNIKHIKDIETDVQNTQDDKPKTSPKVNEPR